MSEYQKAAQALMDELEAVRDEKKAQADRIAKLEAALAWQPIETAPKDGTEILVCFDDSRIRQSKWGSISDSLYPQVWKTVYGETLVRPWKDDPEPTHWMPLPAPPSS